MSTQKDRQKTKFLNINVGIVIFGLILIYLFINIVIYFTTERTKYYEVTAGSNAEKLDNSYQGIALRKEIIKYASQTGYIDYFIREGSRVSKNSTLYSIDSTGQLSDILLDSSKDNSKLTDENLSKINDLLNDFTNNFDDMDFSSVYDFKSTIKGTVVDLINMNSLQKMAKEKGDIFSIQKSQATGIVLYRVDDYETITPKKVKESDFDKNHYTTAHFSSGDKIEKGSPIYKTINDEEWNIVLKFNKSDIKKYKNTSKISVKFLKDNLTTTANFKIVKGKDKKKYGVITLSKYAIRYATDRFLDIEIVETPVSGLKVPKSSVVTSKLYVIPKEYSKKGENGNSIGFNLQNSKTNKSEIYYPPIAYSDDDNYYVAQSYFEPGDVITKSDSHSSYVVERTRDFMGVYNINNGYTVFTIVNILDTLDEYYIVANETSGLEIYDRIVLDASKVSENQIIFQ